MSEDRDDRPPADRPAKEPGHVRPLPKRKGAGINIKIPRQRRPVS